MSHLNNRCNSCGKLILLPACSDCYGAQSGEEELALLRAELETKEQLLTRAHVALTDLIAKVQGRVRTTQVLSALIKARSVTEALEQKRGVN